MKNQSNQSIKIFSVYFFTVIFSMIFLGNVVIAEEENNNNSSSLQQSLSNKKNSKDLLIPMPMGDFGSASERVNINRNPFQDPAKSEITNIDNLHAALQFKGVALSGNKLSAIIKTEDVQKFYEVGDIMENGFTIKSISYEDIDAEVNYETSTSDVTMDVNSIQASYTIAGMTLSLSNEEYDNEAYTVGNKLKETNLAMSIAF